MHHIIINKDFQNQLSFNNVEDFGHYQIVKDEFFKQIWLMLSQGANGMKGSKTPLVISKKGMSISEIS
jgi:hypothetical protein